MKKKGLGKELGAIFGDAALDEIVSESAELPETHHVNKQNNITQNIVAQNDFEYIPIRRIEPNREQPRSLFEQEKIDALAESIREHGILSPLLVRSLDNGYYKIVAGERRWRAARIADLTEIPVRIVSADDRNSLELALVENLQREDLSPIEEARGFRALLNDFDMTQDDVAQRIGRSRPAITNSLRLLTLPDELIALVANGTLHAGSARALLGLKDIKSETLLSVANDIIEKELSVREVERLVKTINSQADKTSQADNEEITNTNNKIKSNDDVDYTLEAQKRLTKALGRRTTIRNNHNKTVIEIEFHGKDDFDILFDALIDFGVTKMGGFDND